MLNRIHNNNNAPETKESIFFYLLIIPAADILLWKRVTVNMSEMQGTPRPSSDI